MIISSRVHDDFSISINHKNGDTQFMIDYGEDISYMFSFVGGVLVSTIYDNYYKRIVFQSS